MPHSTTILLFVVALILLHVMIGTSLVRRFKRRRTAADKSELKPPLAIDSTLSDSEATSAAETSQPDCDFGSNQRQAAIEAGVSEEAADLMEHIITTNRVVRDDHPMQGDNLDSAFEQTTTSSTACLTKQEPSGVDSATQLPGRQSFQQQLSHHFREWMQYRIPVSLLFVEVDGLPELSASQSKADSDQTLFEIGAALIGALPEAALVAQYDDFVFSVILAGLDLEAAKTAGERARSAVAAAAIDLHTPDRRATASVGISTALREDLESSFLARCDSALYAAKKNGRDSVYFFAVDRCLPVAGESSATDDSSEPRIERIQLVLPKAEDKLKQDRRQRRRAPFHQKISVAPYQEGRLPADRDFYQVQCHDISANGISFIFAKLPVQTQFVVILGFGPDSPHVIARIVRTAPFNADGVPLCLVGCSFSGRLS